MSTFVPWVGNKSRCSREIISEFPVKFTNYFEPFLGSGAVFFNLYDCGRIFEKAYLSDSNRNLINAFRAVRDEPDRVKKILLHCCEKNSEEFYYEMRNNMSSPAVFIYVMRAAFSSLYRENSKGQFNTPWRKQDFITMNRKISVSTEDIDVCSKYLNRYAISSLSLSNCKWFGLMDMMCKGDVVYFDPPYCPYNDTGFINYQSDGFNESDHIYLNNMCKQLKTKGVHVYLSNSYTPATVRIYGEPKKIISMTDSVKSKATTKGKRQEALYVY